MAKRDLFNPFHRFQYQYSWFNVQNESQYARLSKRWFYALYGDCGPTMMHTAAVIAAAPPPAAPAAPGAAAPAAPAGVFVGVTTARLLGYLRIPLFSLHHALASHTDANEDEARIGAEHRPHLGILDMIDPVILLSSLRIAMAYGLDRWANQLNMDGKVGAALAVGCLLVFQAVLGIPLGLISTITAVALAIPKAIIAGVFSRLLALITLPFLKEDTSLPVNLPQDEDHPEIIEEQEFQNRKVRRAATKELKKNIDTFMDEKDNENSRLYKNRYIFMNTGLRGKGLPKEMIVNIVKHTAEMPDDGGLTSEEVAWDLLGGAPRPGRG